MKYRGIHAIIYWKNYHCKPLYSAEFSLFPVSKERTMDQALCLLGSITLFIAHQCHFPNRPRGFFVELDRSQTPKENVD